MAQIQATIVKPEAISVTMETTLTIEEWQKVAAVLREGDYWPCGNLAGAIRDVIVKISKQVTERIEGTV